ncbi:3864_t:CDS:2, partial [Ambispora gerdemannii]
MSKIGYLNGFVNANRPPLLTFTRQELKDFMQDDEGRNGKVWREPDEELHPFCIAVTVNTV